MSTEALRSAINAYPGVAGLDAGVANLLGAASMDAVPSNSVLAHHVVLSESVLAIYVVTARSLVLYEASSDGRRFSLLVPAARWKRVLLIEDATGARLSFEIDADRSAVAGRLNEDGSVELSAEAAMYHIVESSSEAVASLRRMAAAASHATLYR